MLRPLSVVMAGACLAFAADPAPSPDEEQRLIAGARRWALNYAKTLPDFECTQTIRRDQKTGKQTKRPLDTLTVRLTYISGREEHELLELNHRPTTSSYVALVGSVGEGEFGGAMHTIFDPASAAEIHWQAWTSLRRKRAAVLAFAVAPETARYGLHYRTLDSRQSAQVGFHGLATIDRETCAVLRLAFEIDHIPDAFPVRRSATKVDYEPVRIAGRAYMLPARAELNMKTTRLESWNRVDFESYHKYGADSRITYGQEK